MHPERSGPEPSPSHLDHFDAWLDAFVAGSSTPAAESSTLPGIPTDPALDGARSAARQLHDLAQAADLAQSRVHTPSVRPDAPSWEDLMNSSMPAPQPVPWPFAAAARDRNRHQSGRLNTINRFLSIAAVLALLIAGASTAWMNRSNLGFGGTPLLQLAASPSTIVTCTTRTLSQEEVDYIVAKYQASLQFTKEAFIPTNKPVARADALAAIATYRADQSCPSGDPSVNSRRWLSSTESESSLALRNLDPGERLTEYKPFLEPLSRVLVPAPATSYVVDRDDPAISPYVINVVGSGTYALLPERFIQFQDGSIGAPLIRAVPGGAASGKDYSKLTVQFVIFTKVDDRWLILGYLSWLCPEDCSAAQGLLDQQIASYIEATPVASPAASPQP